MSSAKKIFWIGLYAMAAFWLLWFALSCLEISAIQFTGGGSSALNMVNVLWG